MSETLEFTECIECNIILIALGNELFINELSLMTMSYTTCAWYCTLYCILCCTLYCTIH